MVSRTDARCEARTRTVLPAVIVQAVIVFTAASASAQTPPPPAAEATPPAAATPAPPAAATPAPPAAATPAPPAAATPAPPPDAAPATPPAAAGAPEALPPAAPPPTEASAADSAATGIDLDDLEVIKVTVDRREKRIQDYAGAASVFTPHDMERTGVRSLRTMGDVSPYVHIGVQEGNTEVYIRGVGNDNNTELGDPAAATHIDGIYIPRPRGVGAMYFDLERVEVGRGPQGTIRGRNATSGSINIITAKPKLKEWAAQASVQLGNYSQKLTQAMVNIPIGDTLALRVASYTENHDPFYTNAGPISTLKASEGADTLAYRVRLKWAPTNKITAVLGHDFMQEKGTGYGGSNFASALAAGIMPNEIKDPRKVIYRGPQGSEDTWHAGVNGDVVVDTGPVMIQYLGSYRAIRYKQTTPGNAGLWYPGMPDQTSQLDKWDHSEWDQRSQSTVQELRVYAPDTDRFRWTLGGFAFYEKQQTFLGQICDNCGGYTGGEYTMPNVKGSSYAGYLDGTFDVTKSFRVTGGIRFTTEEKSRTGIGNQYNFNGDGSSRFGTEGFQYAGLDRANADNFGGSAAADAAADPRQVFLAGVSRWGVRDNLLGRIQNSQAQLGNGLNYQDGYYSDQFFDWRVGVENNVTPSNLLYATVSTGHHSGGFNDSLKLPDGSSITKTYKPENLIAFEIGSKNEFLDRKARVNVALFDYEYTDMQYQNVVPLGPPPGPNTPAFSAAVRDNAAQSRIMGAEIGGDYQFPLGITAKVDALLLDAKFIGDSRVRDPRISWSVDDSQKVSLDGKWLPKASRLTLNYSLTQTLKTPYGYFDWVVSAQTRSKYYLTVFNGEGTDTQGNPNPGLHDAVDTYTRIDLGVGHTRPDGKLRFEGFVNNLTDVWYTNSIINQPNLNLRFVNPPRQFGVKVTVYM